MTEYLKEREGDGCPRWEDVDTIQREYCEHCTYREFMWICKDGTIRITCKYDNQNPEGVRE